MEQVISRDGTPIAFERSGSGQALVLVGGGADDGTENAPLAERFTADNYARRAGATAATPRRASPRIGHGKGASTSRIFGRCWPTRPSSPAS